MSVLERLGFQVLVLKLRCASGAIFEQLFSFVSMVQYLSCQKGARFHHKVPVMAKIFEKPSVVLNYMKA